MGATGSSLARTLQGHEKSEFPSGLPLAPRGHGLSGHHKDPRSVNSGVFVTPRAGSLALLPRAPSPALQPTTHHPPRGPWARMSCSHLLGSFCTMLWFNHPHLDPGGWSCDFIIKLKPTEMQTHTHLAA